MKYKIHKSAISGHIHVPSSKSHTMRALLFALMAKGTSTLRNCLISPDTLAMIDAIKMFGAKVQCSNDVIEVQGIDRVLQRPYDVIQAGNSGLILRFIAAVGALCDCYVIITGDESIRKRRPIEPLLKALTSQNLFAKSACHNGHAPIIIKGPLKPGVITIEGSDSQPVSALLIATAFLKGESEIYVDNPGEKPWIDVTLKWLENFGVKIINHDYRHYKISGGAFYQGFDVTIPGDFSSAAYSIVAALIGKKNLSLSGLKMNDTQADKHFISILKNMGADIQFCPQTKTLKIDGQSQIKGMEVEVNDCIDQTPLLAVLGCFASSPVTIKGARIARFKESDRISAIASELGKMGALIKEYEDGMIIYPSNLKGANLYSHLDHRIALSLIVAGFAAQGETIIDEVDCIAKTYPTFLSDFKNIGGKII